MHRCIGLPNVFGIQAAVSVGLGVSILPEVAILPDHSILGAGDGFPPIPDTEVGTRCGAGGERSYSPSCGGSRRFLQRSRSPDSGMTRVVWCNIRSG